MAAVQVTGTGTSTSKASGTMTGDDVRVLTGDLMSTSVWALHITNGNKTYITQGGTVRASATTNDIQSLQRLLNSAFSGA